MQIFNLVRPIKTIVWGGIVGIPSLMLAIVLSQDHFLDFDTTLTFITLLASFYGAVLWVRSSCDEEMPLSQKGAYGLVMYLVIVVVVFAYDLLLKTYPGYDPYTVWRSIQYITPIGIAVGAGTYLAHKYETLL